MYDEYASGYWGKQTLPAWNWGGADLAISRFSGRPAQPPQGLPKIMAATLDAESVTHVFTPGNEASPAPGFMAMAFPPPAGIETARVSPEAAGWVQPPGMSGAFRLPYEAVRSTADPRATLLSFLRSTYEAAADLAGWDRELLEQRSPDLLRAA